MIKALILFNPIARVIQFSFKNTHYDVFMQFSLCTTGLSLPDYWIFNVVNGFLPKQTPVKSFSQNCNIPKTQNTLKKKMKINWCLCMNNMAPGRRPISRWRSNLLTKSKLARIEIKFTLLTSYNKRLFYKIPSKRWSYQHLLRFFTWDILAGFFIKPNFWIHLDPKASICSDWYSDNIKHQQSFQIHKSKEA